MFTSNLIHVIYSRLESPDIIPLWCFKYTLIYNKSQGKRYPYDIYFAVVPFMLNFK